MNEHSARVRGRSSARKQRARRHEFLLIDVSNSFTKLAFASRAKVGRAIRLPTKKISAQKLRQILARNEVETIVACSVVPKKNREIRRAAKNRRLLWLTPRSRLNVRIDYPNPASIGADRLANAVAVTKLYGTPAIVIDFGTAVTFDIVSAEAAYIGGVIAPGLEAMTTFLYDRTALLPRISLRAPKSAIGRSTRDAMMAGAVFGYFGLVREILQRIIAERFARKHVHIVATGGYAKLIAGRLSEVKAVRENLTLEGLRIFALLNTNASEK